MKLLVFASSLVIVLMSPVVSAQESKTAVPTGADALAALPAEERATHQELIALRIGMQNAFNKMGASGKAEDMQALLEYVHPDMILTAMNGQSVRGKEGLMDYFNRMMVKEGHTVASLHHDFSADHLSILLRPDVATNRGTSRGSYVFTDGSQFTIDTRWTATMVKDQGRWKLAAFQFGPSIFENPVVDAYKAWIYKAAAIAGVVALLLGVFIGRWTRRTRTA
ncbi:MAG: nuclear transport factor 2 family protein [bacterium]